MALAARIRAAFSEYLETTSVSGLNQVVKKKRAPQKLLWIGQLDQDSSSFQLCVYWGRTLERAIYFSSSNDGLSAKAISISAKAKVFINRLTNRQDRTAILGGILPMFLSFSADYGTPSAVFLPTWLEILTISADFRPKMVPHPYYKLKHGTPSAIFPATCLRILPIFCPCSAHFLPIFHLTFRSFSTGPVLQGRHCCHLCLQTVSGADII